MLLSISEKTETTMQYLAYICNVLRNAEYQSAFKKGSFCAYLDNTCPLGSEQVLPT